ncbi:hypothetical protein Tco_1121168 [Tanacetum coccineum]|uniref:Uncharacterized protein n=1 Tax=Tanacetum coccineum TaxID=301880 RepID=A0ABQ5IZJ1_9ASTR
MDGGGYKNLEASSPGYKDKAALCRAKYLWSRSKKKEKAEKEPAAQSFLLNWNFPVADDDEYTVIYIKPKAITPDLPIEEPDNSLNMGDEHLNTILETEKSSVENLVPIPNSSITSPRYDYLPEEIRRARIILSSPIPVLDSHFLVEEVDTFLVPKDSIPPGIESDLDSEGDIIFLDNLLNDDPIPEYERFTFDMGA